MSSSAIIERAVDVLERLTQDGSAGHSPQPITNPEHVEIQRRANEGRLSGEPGRSLRWWCCDSSGDKPVNPSSDPNGRVWGEVWHDRWQAHQDAKALLGELSGSGSEASL